MKSSTIPTLTKTDIERLYLKEGKSVHDIALLFKCSDNKVNYWFAKFGIAKRTISEAIYLKRNPNGDPFLFKKPQSKEDIFLFGLGLGLYWGEGTKRNRTAVRLGNTDPALVKAFILFLQRNYGVPKEKFRFGIQVFSDMKPKEVLAFWTKHLGFPAKHFGKVIVTPTRGEGSYTQKVRHGVLTVYVSNKKLRDLLCAEIDKLRQMP